MDSEDFIQSAVESEISRMLAKNARRQNSSSYQEEIVPMPNIKQEPMEEMEQEPSMQGSAEDYITQDSEEQGYNMVQSMAAAGTGSGKYSVKVVTKYMCRYCARQFDSPDEMQEHIASHSRGKNNQCHSCFVCNKTYSTPSKLQRHVRVHSGERPYACNICGRRFTRSDHVKQHLKVHMPQKQKNTCRLCNQKFLRRQTLHSHLQLNHGLNTVYTCHRCGEAFDEITKLHSHKTAHISIYGKNDGPAVEGGMVIKQEPDDATDPNTPMIGLAKFSLGPQPAPEELIKIMNANHQQKKDAASNGFAYKIDGFVADETHRLAVSIPKKTDNAPMKPKVTTYSYPLRYEQDVPPEREEEAEPSEDEAEGGGTVSDGMNMFILPSDIKKEPGSPDNSMQEGMDDSYKSDECQTSYLDDVAEEDDDNSTEYMNEPNVKIEGENVQNLLTGPPEEHKGIKMKLFGPASYKAAMRNKIAMKIPTPQLRYRQSQNQVSSAASKADTNVSPLKQPSKAFSPYIVSTTGAKSSSSTPVQETLSKEKEKKLSKCEHCCIWFEDYTMCLLHNSLHSADEGDPFTCRKCMKKLGNRLEFTAHLVWHLEPDMDN